MLRVPVVEEAPLPTDPATDETEAIPELPTDDAELAAPTDAEGDTPEADITEPEEEGDVGDGTGYVSGEEEAEGYEDPVNDTPDPEYVDVDALPDEDAVKAPKGIDYLLEDGVLKVNTGLNGELSAWATVYATEPEKTVEFSYNHNGLRTQKKVTTKTVVNNVEQTVVETTDYTLHGKLITHLTKRTAVNGGAPTTEEMHFFYDAQSRPAMVEYGEAMYTYLHNLQGDIIGIVDSAGKLVVRYGYDAWGKPTEVWSEDDEMLAASLITAYATLAALNPFRYRGYVWDAETGLYYLRSRYYNCNWNRFINTDIFIGTKNTILNHNTFVYCINKPINMTDETGYSNVEYIMQYQYITSADGPYPFVDLAFLGILGLAAIADAINGIIDGTDSKNSASGAKSVAEEIGGIAKEYGVGKCKEAAAAIAEHLMKQKKEGKIVTIIYPAEPGYIVSDTYGDVAISENGIHVGILYQGYIYCNIHPYGLPEAEWLADFHGYPEWARMVNYAGF